MDHLGKNSITLFTCRHIQGIVNTLYSVITDHQINLFYVSRICGSLILHFDIETQRTKFLWISSLLCITGDFIFAVQKQFSPVQEKKSNLSCNYRLNLPVIVPRETVDVEESRFSLV